MLIDKKIDCSIPLYLCLLCVLSYLVVHHIAHATFMQYVLLLCSQCLYFGWHGLCCCSQRESDIRPLRRDGGRNRSQTWVSALCLIMGEMISFLWGQGDKMLVCIDMNINFGNDTFTSLRSLKLRCSLLQGVCLINHCILISLSYLTFLIQ